MRTPLRLLALLPLLACGTEEPPPDRTIDTSCGLDCEAQRRYGLVIGRCFEYSDDPRSTQTPAALGAEVLPVETLEGGVQALPVQYTQAGQIRMTDYFVFEDLELRLARRVFPLGRSVTYLGEDTEIEGVTWLTDTAAVGNTYATDTQAQVNQGTSTVTPTRYQVSVTEASASQRTSLAGEAYTNPLQLLFSGQGDDSLRVFVADTGFVQLNSRLSLDTSGAATEFRLQEVRELGGEAEACGQKTEAGP